MSIVRTLSRYSCCLLLGALSLQSNAQVVTSTIVRSDSFATVCSHPILSSCFSSGPAGSGFVGGAMASAAVGHLGATASFTAEVLFQLAGQENFARAKAEWTDLYIVPPEVTHIDFRFHATGQYEFLPGSDLTGFELLSTFASLTMRDPGFHWNAGASLLDAGDGRDFVIGIDRFDFPGSPDKFASVITTELDVLAGITTTDTDQLVSGTAFADFFHTAQLVELDLFGADGRITDIATVTGSSGHIYNVAGFVGNVPEPSTYALLLLGLAFLPLARRGLPRQNSRTRRMVWPFGSTVGYLAATG